MRKTYSTYFCCGDYMNLSLESAIRNHGVFVCCHLITSDLVGWADSFISYRDASLQKPVGDITEIATMFFIVYTLSSAILVATTRRLR